MDQQTKRLYFAVWAVLWVCFWLSGCASQSLPNTVSSATAVLQSTASPTTQPSAIPTTTSTTTPIPFDPASNDETLIIIARFHRTDGIVDTDTHNEIRRAIDEAANKLNLSNLRVEVELTSFTTDDQTKAEKLGKKYNANMIIWGRDTDERVTVNFLNLKQQNFETAEVSISSAERTQIGNPPAYNKFITTELPAQLAFLSLFTLGLTFSSQEKYEKSINVIEEAVNYLPTGIEPIDGASAAYFYLGWLYQVSTNNLNQAIADYSKAIELDPNAANVYNNRGVAYYALDEYDLAVADYSKAIELDPNAANVYNNRGVAYYALDEYDLAVADYSKAIELDPNYAYGYYNRGVAYYALAEYDLAVADYSQAIELDPNYAYSYYNRGAAYYALDEYDLAAADFKKYKEAVIDLIETLKTKHQEREKNGD